MYEPTLDPNTNKCFLSCQMLSLREARWKVYGNSVLLLLLLHKSKIISKEKILSHTFVIYNKSCINSWCFKLSALVNKNKNWNTNILKNNS